MSPDYEILIMSVAVTHNLQESLIVNTVYTFFRRMQSEKSISFTYVLVYFIK